MTTHFCFLELRKGRYGVESTVETDVNDFQFSCLFSGKDLYISFGVVFTGGWKLSDFFASVHRLGMVGFLFYDMIPWANGAILASLNTLSFFSAFMLCFGAVSPRTTLRRATCPWRRLGTVSMWAFRWVVSV